MPSLAKAAASHAEPPWALRSAKSSWHGKLPWSCVTGGKYYYDSHPTGPHCRETPRRTKNEIVLSIPVSGTFISMSERRWVKCWEAACPHSGVSGNWDWVKAFQTWITLQKQALANINQRLKVSFHTIPSICDAVFVLYKVCEEQSSFPRK